MGRINDTEIYGYYCGYKISDVYAGRQKYAVTLFDLLFLYRMIL